MNYAHVVCPLFHSWLGLCFEKNYHRIILENTKKNEKAKNVVVKCKYVINLIDFLAF